MGRTNTARVTLPRVLFGVVRQCANLPHPRLIFKEDLSKSGLLRIAPNVRLCCAFLERRGVPEPGARVHPGNRVQSREALQQVETDYTHQLYQGKLSTSITFFNTIEA